MSTMDAVYPHFVDGDDGEAYLPFTGEEIEHLDLGILPWTRMANLGNFLTTSPKSLFNCLRLRGITSEIISHDEFH